MTATDNIHRRFRINFYMTVALFPVMIFLNAFFATADQKLLSAGIKVSPRVMAAVENLILFAGVSAFAISVIMAVTALVLSARRRNKVLFGLGLKTLILDMVYVSIILFLASSGGG